MTNEVQYVTHEPTLAERFWCALGFRSRYPEMSDEAEKMPGWIMTNVTIDASLLDRLRFLVSGRALVRVETRTSLQVDAVSASSFEVTRPGRQP